MTRWTLFAIALLLPATAMAMPSFPDWIPNGGEFTCNVCHVSAIAPVTWNNFGEDVRDTMENDFPAWAALCGLDSDGDDASNGAELGDPDCTWVYGDSDPPDDPFDPSDPASTPEPATSDPTPEDAGGSTEPDAGGSGSGSGSGSGASGGGTTSGSDGGGGGGGDGGGCNSGSTAPLTGMALLMGLALFTRRRCV